MSWQTDPPSCIDQPGSRFYGDQSESPAPKLVHTYPTDWPTIFNLITSKYDLTSDRPGTDSPTNRRRDLPKWLPNGPKIFLNFKHPKRPNCDRNDSQKLRFDSFLTQWLNLKIQCWLDGRTHRPTDQLAPHRSRSTDKTKPQSAVEPQTAPTHFHVVL